MSKDIVISSVKSRLASLGIGFTLGNGADILIDKEFLDAGWSTGNKKISYQASAYFDENENTIYLWELTKETGSGFSFGSSNETSFQSGKTLFRKVKAVQYGPDGKAYELNLDLGAIPKSFKEAGEQYGWRFKQVLKREKASYPAGTASSSSITPPQTAPVFSPKVPMYQTSAPKKSKKPTGKTFSIGFILLALSAVILMWLGECSTLGWIISAALLFLYFLLGKLLQKSGYFIKILFFIVIALFIFVNFVMTAGVESDAPTESAPAVDTSSQTLPAGTQSAPAAFEIDYLAYGLWPNFTYRSGSGSDKNLGASGDITFSLYANPTAFTDPMDKVSKATVTVTPLKAPAYGTVKLYRMRSDLACAPFTPADMSTYSLPLSFDLKITENYSEGEKPENYLISYDNSISNGQIRFYYCIDNVMPIDPSISSWESSMPVAVSKGITSDTLRSNIGIEILVTMKSGEQHRIYFEREMVAGDFFSKTRLSGIHEDYQGKVTPIVSEKIG